MSLQVWLPLNGDLHNQGLGNITINNNGATVDNNGKIGKCYYFNASSYLNETSYDWSTFNTSEFSLCCWYKQPSPVASGNSQIICIGTNSGWNNIRIGLLRRTSNGYPMFSVSDGTNAVQYGFTATSFSLDTWNHIAVTYNNGEMKMYINGVLDKTLTTTIIPTLNSSQHLGIGSASNGAEKLTGYLNDVRIYDHALSPKEVEEIAKGLVLHYKLDSHWLAENLLVNTHFDGRYSQTTGWDTSKNGTLLANSWGGYNSGVANQATVYHAHLKEVNGEYVYEYIKDANNSWLGISQGGLQSKLTAGTKYTFSWEQYCVSGSNYVNTGLYYYKTGASSAGFHLGYAYGNSGRVIGQWQKFTYTFTAPSDADYAKNMSWYVYGAQGGNGTFYARHFKLEKGDKATPWSPAKTDTLYAALGYNGTTIYDSSGYSNNGTITGTLTAAASSPRYAVATSKSNGSYIRIDKRPIEITAKDAITVNMWVNFSTWGNSISCTEGGGWNFEEAGGGLRFPVYIASVGYKVAQSTITSASLKDSWHMLTGTMDKDNVKIYIDGAEQGTIATGSTNGIGYANNYIFIGAEAAGNTTTPASSTFVGKMSDVRIYATALTVDQVKELYNTSMSVDSSGNIHARELVDL